MSRLPILILVASLSLAGALAGLHSIFASAELSPSIDDSGWQVSGNVFHYQATLPGLTNIISFDTIVHERTSTLVKIDVVILDGTQSFALQASYDINTREDVSRAGVYAPLWIRQADVDRGFAKFGNRNLTYDAVQSTLEHVFTDAESEYAFHKSGGYLVRVENARSGGLVTLVSKGSGAALPVAPQTTESTPIIIEGTDELEASRTWSMANGPVRVPDVLPVRAMASSSSQYQYPIATLDATCSVPSSLSPDLWPVYSLDGYYSDKCTANFYVETVEDYSYGKFRLSYPRFAMGRVEAWYRDEDTSWGGGVVRHYVCAPLAGISTVDLSVQCAPPTYPREFSDAYAPGENWIETQGVWNFCLDPTTGWSCKYTWTTPATGHITCYEENERCDMRD